MSFQKRKLTNVKFSELDHGSQNNKINEVKSLNKTYRLNISYTLYPILNSVLKNYFRLIISLVTISSVRSETYLNQIYFMNDEVNIFSISISYFIK